MIKAGGEVDAFCVKCDLTLAHTVHAVVSGKPVKVECNTCHAVHRYRAPAGAAGAVARTTPKKGREPREKRVVTSFDDLLAARKGAPIPYSPRHAFAEGDVVEHPTFGRGFVSGVRSDKVEVTFRSDVKTLVHARS